MKIIKTNKKRIIKLSFQQFQNFVVLYANNLIEAAYQDFESNTKKGNIFDPDSYYCGITNNIKRRESEHKAHFIKYINTYHREFSKFTERVMEKMGFDTGRRAGNGAKPDSKYIYIYRKIPGKTIENIPD